MKKRKIQKTDQIEKKGAAPNFFLFKGERILENYYFISWWPW